MDIPDIIILKPNRVWRSYLGGKFLDKLEGKPTPQDSFFPEDWIASTTRAINKGREHLEDEGLSKVDINEIEYKLIDLIIQNPKELIGKEHYKKYGPTTQFLLKYLDSAIRLHIQCHPTIPFAKRFLNSDSGKTEAYYILAIRENIKNPYIYLGFQHPPTKEDFKKTIENQDIDKLLSYFKKISIKPGDTFIVPGGLPHAIGGGVFMIEILEPTDFCVRAEFERGGYVLPIESRFMNKGIDFALSMFNYYKISKEEVQSKYFLKPKMSKKYNKDSIEYILIDESVTVCFRLKKLIVKGEIEKNEDSFYIGIVISGEGFILAKNKQYKIEVGDKFFIPNITKEVFFKSDNGIEIIIALPPL